jgi:hypothetical protein
MSGITRGEEVAALFRSGADSAFGLPSDAAAEPFRIAMAALDLVAEVAAEAPVLPVAEDAQWHGGRRRRGEALHGAVGRGRRGARPRGRLSGAAEDVRRR